MEAKNLGEKSQRNSNAEVLRIIAMLMIVASHYSYHGIFRLSQVSNFANYIILKMMTLGNLGVDIFILLFGYYSISSKEIKFRKVFLLWSQVFVYSTIIFIGLNSFGIIEFSLKTFAKSFLPTILSNYWFFTVYIVFLLLTPFANKLLTSLTKREYKALLVTMLVLWCIIPTIYPKVLFSDVFSFMLLYSLGGYIKLFQDTKCNKKRIGGYMIAASALLMFGSSVAFCFLGKAHPMFVGLETYFFHKNSIFTILIALGMLIFAVNQKPRYKKAVNLISSCTFGIYLLHDNSLIRRFIWSDLLRAPTLANSPFMIVHCFGSVLTIFLAGIIIELIRKHTIEKLVVFVYDKVIEKNKKIKRKETRGSNDVTIQE